MSFLLPWAAWFLAGLPVIVLLYLLKLKRRPLPVSTLLFWQRVLQENRRSALFQKLRRIFSLLLQLLIFLLILAALARPVWDRAVRAGSSTVLILDTRARMQAREAGGATRLALAQKLATGTLAQAGGQRQFALLTASAAPAVVAPFTDDEAALRQALKTVAATDATGNLADAIGLAEQLLAARQGAKRIIVFSAPGAAAQLQPVPANVEFVTVGTVHENVAITRFAPRPMLSSPQTSEVLLEVANFGDAPAQGNLEVSYDGRLLEVKPFNLAAGAHQVQVFPIVPQNTASTRGWLTARLTGSDALPADNVAYAVLPPRTPQRVLLVTKGNWFLEKMLAADPGVNSELLAPDAFSLPLATKFAAVILDNCLPAGFDLAQAAGNFFFIKQTPFASAGADLEQPLITETDARQPVLRLVNLQNVTVVRASALAEPAAGGDWQFAVPIRSETHPLMITGERRTATGPQRLAALALDLTDSDLPLRVAFPLLMANTVEWLAGEAPAVHPQISAGETLPLTPAQRIGAGPQTDWSAELPAASTAQIRGFFQPSRNGFYRLEQPEGAGWLAVNTFSAAESDLRVPASVATPRTALPTVALAQLAGWPLWHYLALAALLLFTLEWWLFHRRRTE